MSKSMKRGDRRFLTNKKRKERICDVINHWKLKGEFGWQNPGDDWFERRKLKIHSMAGNHHPNIGQGTYENDGWRENIPRLKELRSDFSDGDINSRSRKAKRRRTVTREEQQMMWREKMSKMWEQNRRSRMTKGSNNAAD